MDPQPVEFDGFDVVQNPECGSYHQTTAYEMTPMDGTYSWITYSWSDKKISISTENLADVGDYTINLRAIFTGDYTFTIDPAYSVNTLNR